ncbi:MAG: pyrimidine reductase family protein [Actinomycetes bacterium]
MYRLVPGPRAEMDLDELAAAYAYPDPLPTRGWLRANMVTTLDGAATHDGVSSDFTSSADQQLLGLLRAMSDVVVVGAGTVRAEGYGPTRAHTRHAARRAAAGQLPAPVLAIVSGRLDLDPASTVFADAVVRPTVVTHAASPAAQRSALEQVADVLVCGATRVDLPSAIDALAERGLRRLLTEGGPRLLADLLRADRVDELDLTFSSTLAGPGAPRIVAGEPLASLEAMTLSGVLQDGSTLFARYTRDRP